MENRYLLVYRFVRVSFQFIFVKLPNFIAYGMSTRSCLKNLQTDEVLACRTQLEPYDSLFVNIKCQLREKWFHSFLIICYVCLKSLYMINFNLSEFYSNCLLAEACFFYTFKNCHIHYAHIFHIVILHIQYFYIIS